MANPGIVTSEESNRSGQGAPCGGDGGQAGGILMGKEHCEESVLVQGLV